MSSRDGRGHRRLSATEVDFDVVRQRALLVGTGVGSRTVADAQASLEELALLADTAGADPVESVLQRRDRPDPATYVGPGKAEELFKPFEQGNQMPGRSLRPRPRNGANTPRIARNSQGAIIQGHSVARIVCCR